MNTLKLLDSLLYTLSGLFIYPVIIALFLLLAIVIFSTGTFCKEYWCRNRNKLFFIQPFIDQIYALDTANQAELEIKLNHVLEQAEQKSYRAIHSARYSVKMGPTLGLIGTLTPMAKALSGLSQGNLNSLSSQMITAFSTTVIGLVVGGIAYTLMHVRLKWQRKDLYQLSKLAEEKLTSKVPSSTLITV